MRIAIPALTLCVVTTVGCGLIRPYDTSEVNAALDGRTELDSGLPLDPRSLEGPDANTSVDREDASTSPDSSVAPSSRGFSQACLRAPNLTVAKGLHVVSVYTPATIDTPDVKGHGKGSITVNVAAGPEPVTLYLSSYHPVAWKLVPAVGATIAKVVTSSFFPDETTVSGTAAPVVNRTFEEAGGCSYGWEPKHNSGGCTFSKVISQVRAREQNLEASFQGEYAATSFTIPHAEAPTSHYESSEACSNACIVPAGSATWSSIAPSFAAAIAGTKATYKSDWSIVEGAHGAACGKHYFELEFSGEGHAADMDMVRRGTVESPQLGGGQSDSSFLWNVTATTLGVAVDLDAMTVSYQEKTGGVEGAKITKPMNVWTYGEVVPGVTLRRGSVTFVGRPPFQLAAPAGYVADF